MCEKTNVSADANHCHTSQHAKPVTEDLRRTLSLLADSAFDADNAITLNDIDGLDKAMAALRLNVGTTHKLAVRWKARR